jgi:hypothetical protein
VPLSNFVQRGFGFVHHSIAILYHQVPNPNITIRNFFIAVRPVRRREGGEQGAVDVERTERGREREAEELTVRETHTCAVLPQLASPHMRLDVSPPCTAHSCVAPSACKHHPAGS